jgi:hypothetical protein
MRFMNSTSMDLSTLRSWLLESEYTAIIEHARSEKRMLSLLTALTYDTKAAISERAIRATGLAAKVIAEYDPEYVRNYLLRLFWLLSEESGGIGWKAPELIGEILFHCPQFTQFFPMLISLLDMEEEDASKFRVGTIWAVGRVAQVAHDDMQPAREWIKQYLNDEDDEIKAISRWCLAQLDR